MDTAAHYDPRPWEGPIPLNDVPTAIQAGDLVRARRGASSREGIAYVQDDQGRWLDRYRVLLTPTAHRGNETLWTYWRIPAPTPQPLPDGPGGIILAPRTRSGWTADAALRTTAGAWLADWQEPHAGRHLNEAISGDALTEFTDQDGTRWTRADINSPWRDTP